MDQAWELKIFSSHQVTNVMPIQSEERGQGGLRGQDDSFWDLRKAVDDFHGLVV